jgi:small subunit ribosomal protein S16e
MSTTKAVQTFGKKKVRFLFNVSLFIPIYRTQTATAVAHTKEGRGLIHINGSPIATLQPEILRFKIYEAVLAAGEENFACIDIRTRVKGGGHTSQVYALRQAIAKAVVAYHAKYIDASSALDLKKKFVSYDRSLLISDPRRAEPKKFGGRGARARRQKRSVQPLLSIEPLLDPITLQLPLICFAAALHLFSIIVCRYHKQHDLYENNRISKQDTKHEHANAHM